MKVKDKGIMSAEHRKAISVGMKRKFSNMTEKEWEERTRKRVLKAQVKNMLYKKFLTGEISL